MEQSAEALAKQALLDCGHVDRYAANPGKWAVCLDCVIRLLTEQARAKDGEIEMLLQMLDIQTFRPCHDLSFADPPSYHETDVKDLWDCPVCVERYIERARAAAPEPPRA